jgi:hypothetical protein
MIDRHAGRRELDRIRRLLEEERRLAVRVRSHLTRVRRIVAADAIDPPHRKLLVTAGDRNEHLRDRKRHSRALRIGRQRRRRGAAGDHCRSSLEHIAALDRLHDSS